MGKLRTGLKTVKWALGVTGWLTCSGVVLEAMAEEKQPKGRAEEVASKVFVVGGPCTVLAAFCANPKEFVEEDLPDIKRAWRKLRAA